MQNSTGKTRIFVLLGPTASGKSAAALDLAPRVNAEILSVDSMQVYRGMDVGTAKPTAAERARVPHHLIDVRDPSESFSTAEYVKLADAAVADIVARGKRPLFVGGTALYVKSLLVGIFDGPPADWEFRSWLRAEAARAGPEALHRRLAEVDPVAAARIHPNDLRRVERALEIHHKTGLPASALRTQWSSESLRYDARIVGLSLPRPELLRRIDERIDNMIASGWPREVERLLSDPSGLSREASQALGYAELARVASGQMSLDAAVAEIKRKTHRFAKAQMTWFKTFPNVTWIDAALDKRSLVDKLLSAFGFADG